MSTTAAPPVDVLIVGAGLSGIGAGCRLRISCPSTSFAILESRSASGGTWDLFRYPGVRSDSDMHTLGYRFRPWTGTTALADGPEILRYVRETAEQYGVDRRIEYGVRVVGAHWSCADARWTVTVRDAASGEESTRTCRFLYLCTGYYRYDEGYTPEFAGREEFGGTVVHPQQWPDTLDVHGKRVVVIGSGATAVTLVPALAREGAQVTMLQRSPSYIFSLPSRDPVAAALGRVLPEGLSYRAVRWKNIKIATALYQFCQKHPRRARALLQGAVRRRLPAGYDVDTHFTPAYGPWDQRLCLVPDADLFQAIASGGADVVTDRIDRFTRSGLRLASGRELPADVVVTATGLNLLPLGGIGLSLDGEPVEVSEHVVYKGMMLDGVPNLVFALGYTNASWTLKVDLVAECFTRILRHMDAHGRTVAVPRLPEVPMTRTPFIEMTSGYFERSRKLLPLQGESAPWRLRQHYPTDARLLRGPVDDGALTFG
ncbi:NAD(P)/FAD-dependent oxidoreductase [Actinospica durhamensis]|uniref:NAD(P)/FAD-dependent oxidoreductase n=1 Tax=Actinospica durhamensis TaxID=1508375 RepID=A0A941EMZ6_9ACTN|nr:NAD(P)/FAD-dependent oxidoreductase [Actinospica durhamensis]MBR7835400.1 NAD(P)/FAD-dependent oxidoreductase [Actinospica durhamensis]